jgi:ribonuclease Z
VGPGPQHSSAARVGRAADAHKLPNLVLTHFSARYGDLGGTSSPSLADIEAEARACYPGSLFLARDQAVFTLDAQGQLLPTAPA